jgi:hypothetical protein
LATTPEVFKVRIKRLSTVAAADHLIAYQLSRAYSILGGPAFAGDFIGASDTGT